MNIRDVAVFLVVPLHALDAPKHSLSVFQHAALIEDGEFVCPSDIC